MPADLTLSLDANDFVDAFWLEWDDHPQIGQVTVPRAVTGALKTYLFNEGGITIDISGPPMSLGRCSNQGFNGNFATGDCVLLGDNPPGVMPVHLLFDPPVQAVGAHVSATGPVGRAYLVNFSVLCDDGSGRKFSTNGTTSRQRGTAPFVGARAPAGTGITQIWFDVVDPANQSDFARVAINNLLWEIV